MLQVKSCLCSRPIPADAVAKLKLVPNACDAHKHVGVCAVREGNAVHTLRGKLRYAAFAWNGFAAETSETLDQLDAWSCTTWQWTGKLVGLDLARKFMQIRQVSYQLPRKCFGSSWKRLAVHLRKGVKRLSKGSAARAWPNPMVKMSPMAVPKSIDINHVMMSNSNSSGVNACSAYTWYWAVNCWHPSNVAAFARSIMVAAALGSVPQIQEFVSWNRHVLLRVFRNPDNLATQAFWEIILRSNPSSPNCSAKLQVEDVTLELRGWFKKKHPSSDKANTPWLISWCSK